jgi:hypothetical protein
MRNNLNQKRCGNKINTDDEKGRLLLSSLLYLHSISQKTHYFSNTIWLLQQTTSGVKIACFTQIKSKPSQSMKINKII